MKLPKVGMAALVVYFLLKLMRAEDNPVYACIMLLMAIIGVVDIGWFIRRNIDRSPKDSDK